MFTESIRWRLQLWLAFLLLCVLSGFGVAVSQLHRNNLWSQIDGDLEKRVAALSTSLRGGAPGPPGFGRGGRFGGRDDHGGFDGDSGRGRSGAGRGGWHDDGGRGWPDDHGERGGGPGGPFGADFGRGDGPGNPGHGGPDRGGPDHGRGPFEFSEPTNRARGRGDFPFRDMRMRQRQFKLTAEATRLFDESETNGFYYTVWSWDGTVMKNSANVPGTIPLPSTVKGDTRTHMRTRSELREAYHFTELGDCVLAGRNIATDLKSMRQFMFVMLGAGGTVLAFGLGGGWWLTGRAIRPIEQISSAANRISAGNLSERIRGADADNELGRLATVLNSTFGRLESAFARQKQFTADASHELRTPLAVIISEAQTTLNRPRTPEEYRETIEACLDTAQQMRRLTDSLLELARVDGGPGQLERSMVDFSQVARDAVERLTTLAHEKNVKLESDLAPAQVMSNADRLGQVVVNLIANAIHYNKPGRTIKVAVRVEREYATLTVADSGIGIAAEDLPYIFERFYRADKSRSRAQGRSGLGLAICKAIIEAEGGTIDVTSELGTGSTFTVRLAAVPSAAKEPYHV